MFFRKTWADRISEYPTRRILTDANGDETVVSVARDEGVVSQEGDLFNAETMNDLEGRIGDEFDAVNGKISNFTVKNFSAEDVGGSDVYGTDVIKFLEYIVDNGYMPMLTTCVGELRPASRATYIGQVTTANVAEFIVFGYGLYTATHVEKNSNGWTAYDIGTRYSATEHAVGKWTDNKPIWEKTVTVNLNKGATTGNVTSWQIPLQYGASELIDIYGTVILNGGTGVYTFGGTGLNTDATVSFSSFAGIVSNTIYGYVNTSNKMLTVTSVSLKVTLRYTKA